MSRIRDKRRSPFSTFAATTTASSTSRTYRHPVLRATVGPRSFRTTDFYKLAFQDPNVPVQLPRMSITGTDGERGTSTWVRAAAIGTKAHREQFQREDRATARLPLPEARFRDARHPLAAGDRVLSNPGFGFDARPPAAPTSIRHPGVRRRLRHIPYRRDAPTSGGPSDWDSSTTSIPVINFLTPSARFYGGYVNDDWKITRDLTLNLGLRYEYEQSWRETEDRSVRPLDLTSPIPEFQGANAPQIPAAVRAVLQGRRSLTAPSSSPTAATVASGTRAREGCRLVSAPPIASTTRPQCAQPTAAT